MTRTRTSILLATIGLLSACNSGSARITTPPPLEASLDRTSLACTRGQSDSAVLTLTPRREFDEVLTLVLEKQDGTAAPAGLGLSPTSVEVPGTDPVEVSLSVSSLVTTPTGTTALRVRVVGTGLSTAGGAHCANFSLFVAPKGELDPGFGTDGKLVLDLGSEYDAANAVLCRPDGKIIVASTGGASTNSKFVLCRRNADGSPDTSFGTDGEASIDVCPSTDLAQAMLEQSDGKIVVAGSSFQSSNWEFSVVRLQADGSLDTTFGTGGKVITGVGASADYCYAIAQQADGKLVLAGNALASIECVAVVRLNADGSLDTTFGTGGKLILPVGSIAAQANGVAVQPDGKIVVVGFAWNSTNRDFLLVRLNSDGSLDPGFGSSGIVTTQIGTANDTAIALALQADGKIVAAGTTNSSGQLDFALARYTATGDLDTTFGTGGMVVVSNPTDGEIVSALRLQPDGKIVAAGQRGAGSSQDAALLRFDPNGNLDTTFGAGGLLFLDLAGSADCLYALAIAADGKLVGVGKTYVTSTAGDGFDALILRAY
jgi:uncharacterized delta-60 repeat protein